MTLYWHVSPSLTFRLVFLIQCVLRIALFFIVGTKLTLWGLSELLSTPGSSIFKDDYPHGHTIRLPSNQPPHQVLYGECTSAAGNKHSMYHTKADLKHPICCRVGLVFSSSCGETENLHPHQRTTVTVGIVILQHWLTSQASKSTQLCNVYVCFILILFCLHFNFANELSLGRFFIWFYITVKW